MDILERLRGPGPYDLTWWQWLVVPLALTAAWIAGLFLGRLVRVLLGRAVRRTRVTWDDQIVEGIGRPLNLACAVAVARVAVLWLPLPGHWHGTIVVGLRVVLAVALFWFLLRVVTVGGEIAATSAWAQARPASRSLVPLGARMLQVGVLALALLAVLSDLGFQVTGLLAGLGIGGLALALAAQKTVENLFGAFAMGLDQPFQMGDFISVEGLVTGTVETVGLRSTRIRTPDRTVITVPNGKLADMRIESFATRDRIRFASVLGLTRDTTGAQLRAVLVGLERALRAQPRLWPDSVTVRFKEITPSSFDVEVQAWFLTTDYAEFQGIRQELLLAFLELVEREGTSFALPTRAVHVREGGRLPADMSPHGAAPARGGD
jgi:MscS family membrane protein